MVNRSFLRSMRKEAYLLNTARDGTIDQPVLVQALKEGWIVGAALDVFE